MHCAAVFELEAVVAEVLAALGVVLILVGPVQHDFFARVRNGIGIALVAALANEVAILVIARKEGQQVRENCVFMFGCAGGGSLNLFAQRLHLGHCFRINSQVLCAFFCLLQFRLQVLNICSIADRQCVLHFFLQSVFQIVVNFVGTGIDNAINTEIQIGAIDLKNLAQLGNQFVIFAHVFSCSC